MKKIIITIFVAFLTFMISTNVYATSFYSIILNDVAIHKQSLYVDKYNVGGLIKERGTDKPAYCIEPYVDLIEEYYDYQQFASYHSIFGLSEEQYKRVNDIAYFGYGYGNHTDSKWGTVSQVMIWKTINPNDIYEWVDGLYTRNVISPYNAEMAEIENLIANKNTKPSFITTETLNISGHTELSDTNGVLSFYSIQNVEGVTATIEDNKLIIDTIPEYDSGSISLIRKGEETETKYYYHPGSQNVMIRGGFTPVEAKIDLKVVKGSISIFKVDKDFDNNTSQGEGNINDAIFELFDSDNNLIKTITLDEEGKAFVDDLELGRYILKEKQSGTGYILDDSIYDIEITKDNLDIELSISNKVIESLLKIIKLYGSKSDYINNTMKKESGITFDVYDKNNNLVGSITTDEEGTCEILLPYGTYKVVQKNTTSNYQMVEDKVITIDDESTKEITIVLNDVEIEVPNAGLF